MTNINSKLRVLFGLCCIVAASFAAMAQTPNAKMTPGMSKEDRAQLLKRFDDATKQTLAAVEKLSDAQWSYKAAPEKWSVGETLEHITLAEGLLFGMIEKTLAASADPAWAEKTKDKLAVVERVMLDRSVKVQAPGEIVPTSKLTRAEVMAKYQARRAATRKFIRETKAEVHAHTGDHPYPPIGTLSAYQWLTYTVLHNLRHLNQIEEVKAGAGFPKA